MATGVILSSLESMKTMETKLIFFITDAQGTVWGLAPSKIQARRQINWFLPRDNKYSIEPWVIAA